MVTYPRIYSKNNSGEIRLFQVGTVHIMKGSNKFSALALTITVFFKFFFRVKMIKKNILISENWFLICKYCMWCDCFLSLVSLFAVTSNVFASFFKMILHLDTAC